MPATTQFMQELTESIKANTTLFGGVATELKVGLYINVLNPGPQTTLDDLVVVVDAVDAVFVTCVAAPQVAYFDELAQTWRIKLKEPTGGFIFPTANFVPNNGVVRGFYIINNAANLLYARNFPEPIELIDGFGSINLREVEFEFAANPFA
jgi:hypothetical protein